MSSTIQKSPPRRGGPSQKAGGRRAAQDLGHLCQAQDPGSSAGQVSALARFARARPARGSPTGFPHFRTARQLRRARQGAERLQNPKADQRRDQGPACPA